MQAVSQLGLSNSSCGKFSISLSKESTTWNSVRPKLDVTFVVDRSGSMCTRLDAALEGVRTVSEKRLSADDRLAVLSFGSSVTVHQKLQRKGSVDLEAVLRGIRIDGCTALNDSIATAIKDVMHSSGNRQLELVVLTDGQDTSSKLGTEEVAALVAKPGLRNFHLVLIGVGLCASELAPLRRICRPKHCSLIESSASKGDILKAFGRVSKAIKERTRLRISCSLERSHR